MPIGLSFTFDDLGERVSRLHRLCFDEERPDLLEWAEIETELNKWLAPIIIEFRRAADAQPISREERKRVNGVRREITEALKRMRADQGTDRDDGASTADARGRRRPTRSMIPVRMKEPLGGHHRPPAVRTQAPEDPVGVLERLARKLRKGDEAPPIELDDLDPSVRSEAVRSGDTIVKVLINRAYPLYAEFKGHEAYLAETALMELLMPAATEKTPVTEYVEQLNQCLAAWWQVSQEAAAETAGRKSDDRSAGPGSDLAARAEGR